MNNERRLSPRHKTQLKAHLLFSVQLVGPHMRKGRAPRELNLVGQTEDISETGLALIIPVAEIDESYLKDEGNSLRIELFLPAGPVEIQARPVRYERLGEGRQKSIFAEGYLIGAQITSISDRQRFIEYLNSLADPTTSVQDSDG
ncbi:MAG TPA: PilZ domain-containing protein [Pyrinomonadaceae bacterium]|jgi:hypothetical protein